LFSTRAAKVHRAKVLQEHSRLGNHVYDAAWKRLRKAILQATPLCCQCEAEGRVTEATDVDHITPVAIAPHRRLDSTNLQPLCHSCHSKKTRMEMMA
jgi:5-methylcytosine-specific restriction protein A